MTIYEIDAEVQRILDSAVDENGEVNPEALEQLEALQMERERKVENLALAYKNAKSMAAAIKAEEEALAKRRKAEENSAERTRKYLDFVLGGESFKTSRVSVSHKTTQAVETDETFMLGAASEYLRYKDPEPNKTAIMAALKAGINVPGAKLVTRTSTIVK